MSIELFVECLREAALKGDAASLCAARDVWQDLSKVDQTNAMMDFAYSEPGSLVKKVKALFFLSLNRDASTLAMWHAMDEISCDLGEAIFLAGLMLAYAQALGEPTAEARLRVGYRICGELMRRDEYIGRRTYPDYSGGPGSEYGDEDYDSIPF